MQSSYCLFSPCKFAITFGVRTKYVDKSLPSSLIKSRATTYEHAWYNTPARHVSHSESTVLVPAGNRGAVVQKGGRNMVFECSSLATPFPGSCRQGSHRWPHFHSHLLCRWPKEKHQIRGARAPALRRKGATRSFWEVMRFGMGTTHVHKATLPLQGLCISKHCHHKGAAWLCKSGYGPNTSLHGG